MKSPYEAGKDFLRGGYTAYTPDGADFFKKNGAWFTTPSEGYVVYFYNSNLKRIGHVGIVVSFDRETARLTTIEGNHSDKVEKFTYYDYWGIRFIQGYGILPEHIENPPKYELKEEPQPEPDAPEEEPVPEGTDPRAPIPLKPVQDALPEGAVPETPAPITP